MSGVVIESIQIRPVAVLLEFRPAKTYGVCGMWCPSRWRLPWSYRTAGAGPGRRGSRPAADHRMRMKEVRGRQAATCAGGIDMVFRMMSDDAVIERLIGADPVPARRHRRGKYEPENSGDDDYVVPERGERPAPRPGSGRSCSASDLRCNRRRGAGSGLLRLPEDLVDLGDVVERLLARRRVGGRLGGREGLQGVVDQLVQLGVLLEVRGLEVVAPEDGEWCFASSARCSLMTVARAW